jgi:hypothetical protein
MIGGAAVVATAGCLGDATDPSSEPDTTEGGMTEGDGMDGSDGEMTEGDGMSEGEGTSESEGMGSQPTAVTVRIENVAPTDFYAADTHTNGQVWITPGAYAIHPEGNPLFTEGESASAGLEALAEAGPPTGFPDEPGLVSELRSDDAVVTAGGYTPDDTVTDPNDPTGSVPGAPPIAPGGAFEFTVEAEPGDRLSVASMFVPSNDVFLSPGPTGIELWPTGDDPVSGDVTDAIELWDAGTEPNAQPPGDGPDQAPAQSSPDQGSDEDGVVRRLSSVDDGHRYPSVSDLVRVTLTPTSASGDDGGSMAGSDSGSMTETQG